MGTLLSQPITEQSSGLLTSTTLNCAYSSMQGWRRTMEDTHICLLNDNSTKYQLSLFAVFDGHGGDKVAHYCEQHFFPTLKSNEHFLNGNFPQALIETNLKLDEQMRTPEGDEELKTLGFVNQNSFFSGAFGDLVADSMGCTAVVCLIVDGILYCSNAGDSRAIMVKGNNVVPLSIDHKPHLKSEMDRIYKAGGIIENGRVNGNLNLTRTIGDLMYKRQMELGPENQIISAYPDIQKFVLEGNEQLLIVACDGIWDALTNEMCAEKIVNYLKKGVGLKETCENVLNDCLSSDPFSKPSWDNMSLIIVKFNNCNLESIDLDSSCVSSSQTE